MKKKIIVVSAVNLNVGGTLTILRECLAYLSELARYGNYNIVALVHKKELAYYDNIDYIELPWAKKKWINRLWCEYVTMNRISKELGSVYLWLSLHDTTPNVKAERQAVYCQTSFPFYKWNWRDFTFDYKIPLFACFTRFAYRINVHRNRFLVVQQSWLRDGFSKMLGVDKKKIIVAPPSNNRVKIVADKIELPCVTFLYAAAPDCHKNFEVICRAAGLLEKELGSGKFKVIITAKGDENRYTRYLYKKWNSVDSVCFVGYLNKSELYGYYQAAHCLIHASKVETWGLPISEFMETGKPMLLADLLYAHETAAGSKQTAFFPVTDAKTLKEEMKKIVLGDKTNLKNIPKIKLEEPQARSWEELFEILLKEK